MSNDVRIYSSRAKHSGVFNEAGFLSSRVEASNEVCLRDALKLIHTEAVKNAWQIRDTGLLANSIFYTVDNGQTLEGLNSAGGDHTVMVGKYRERIPAGEIRKTERSFVSTGYVGTAASHDLDGNPIRVKQKQGTEDSTTYTMQGKSGKTYAMTYEDEKGDVGEPLAMFNDSTVYAPLVEYGTCRSMPRPFLKQAYETVRSQMERVVVTGTTTLIKGLMNTIFSGKSDWKPSNATREHTK